MVSWQADYNPFTRTKPASNYAGIILGIIGMLKHRALCWHNRHASFSASFEHNAGIIGKFSQLVYWNSYRIPLQLVEYKNTTCYPYLSCFLILKASVLDKLHQK